MRLHRIWTVRELLAEFKSDRHLSGFNEDKLVGAVLLNAYRQTIRVSLERDPGHGDATHRTEVAPMAPMVVERITLDIDGQPRVLVTLLEQDIYATIEHDWNVIA